MNILVLLSSMGRLSHNGHHIDMAINEIKKGNKVFFLGCDENVGICMSNPCCNPIICKFCKHFTASEYKRFVPEGSELLWVNDFVDKKAIAKLPRLNYNSAEELRALTYKGIMVGYGVLSSYISLTRNLNPKITENSRGLFDAMIREQQVTLMALENLQSKYNFGLYIFQNGRGAQLKPFLNFCEIRNIKFWCTEDYSNQLTHNYMDNYWCTAPHSITARTKRYFKAWDTEDYSMEEKNRIGRSFFEKRRNAMPSMDKIYTKNQVSGMMPEGWCCDVENIVIFNSSEDEFCALNKEFDAAALFKSQLDGIQRIVEHYADDKTKHFTLRVHPNLKGISYKYHKDLYELNYPNLTVIPGDSPISTYSLMDAADKVVVFGSSTGAEASYWGKPVICLAGAFYLDLNIVHKPSSIDELWAMLDNRELPCLSNDNLIKYGFYIMTGGLRERTKHIDIDISWFHFFNKKCACYNYQKFLGSKYLYAVLNAALYTLKSNWPAKYRPIPIEEE